MTRLLELRGRWQGEERRKEEKAQRVAKFWLYTDFSFLVKEEKKKVLSFAQRKIEAERRKRWKRDKEEKKKWGRNPSFFLFLSSSETVNEVTRRI